MPGLGFSALALTVSGCASRFRLDPEGARVLHVLLLRVKSGEEREAEGKE